MTKIPITCSYIIGGRTYIRTLLKKKPSPSKGTFTIAIFQLDLEKIKVYCCQTLNS